MKVNNRSLNMGRCHLSAEFIESGLSASKETRDAYYIRSYAPYSSLQHQISEW